MTRTQNISMKSVSWWLQSILLVALLAAGCSQPADTPSSAAPTVKIVPAGQENSGFLKDYSKLTPHPEIEGTQTYTHPDELKGLRGYVAMIVEARSTNSSVVIFEHRKFDTEGETTERLDLFFTTGFLPGKIIRRES